MAMSSVSKFSRAKSEFDVDELRLELTALQKTKDVMIKFLEVVQCVNDDIETMTKNYMQLKQVNQQWADLVTQINENPQ